MEPQWLTYAKRLQAIASTGLHFSKDPYDRERFDEIATIANEMLATLGHVPIERIEALVSDFARGYATPRVDVRGAIIEDDAILLVRERSDSRWTLPGGFADVGRSVAQNIEKEMLEEAGLRFTARRLYAVRYKASGSYSADVRDFYKMFSFAIASAAANLPLVERRAKWGSSGAMNCHPYHMQGC
ncbi:MULTISPECIES: NUDIX hydrolase N-terminal domain-containing protein [unclassified Bradyrhizobium]|uniref:NUDIX hydrolase n=1 Tax=unclassified Bradyrhizobium TaxID=2631580 RepID=UPI001CD19A3F|nr:MULTISPECIES: NUDIX hydrolase N-terminal domain-containing protein [unclassified Bradyrhizobium]